jgi:hypothetical protein
MQLEINPEMDTPNKIVITECLCRESSGFTGSPINTLGDDGPAISENE